MPARIRVAEPLRLFCVTALALSLSACGGGGGSSSSSEPASLAAALPVGNAIAFADASVRIEEDVRYHQVDVIRTGAAASATQVEYRLEGSSAEPGVDVVATSGRLSWDAGDLSSRQIGVRVLSDLETELDEQFTLVLENLQGDDRIDGTGRLDITLGDSACSGRIDGRITDDVVLDEPCYLLESDVVVAGSAVVSLLPGVTVLGTADADLLFQDDSTLLSVGTEERPVVLAGAESGANAWQGVTLATSSQLHAISHTELSDSAHGVLLAGDSQFADFASNSFSDMDGAALRVPLSTVSSIDEFTRFERVAGGIEIFNGSLGNQDPAVQLAALGTHYVIDTTLAINGPLTIEAGTELRFRLDTLLQVFRDGSLNAIGTAASPIVFRGETAEPGHWRGVHITQSESEANQLSHVTIQHGGRDGARSTNLGVQGGGVALHASDVTLSDSFGHGLRVEGASPNLVFERLVFKNNRLEDDIRF